MSPETKSQISTIPAKETPKRNEQIGTPKSPEERKSEVNIRKNEAWQNLQKIPTQVAENVIKLFGKISGKVPQITTSQIPQIPSSQKAGNNEIKSTTYLGQKVEIPNQQVEVKEAGEMLTQTQIPLKEPTKEKLALIQLKRQEPISKTREVVGYTQEGKKSPEEVIKRKELAGQIHQIRSENGIIKTELKAISEANKSMTSENDSISKTLNGGHIIKNPFTGEIKQDIDGLNQNIEDTQSKINRFTDLEKQIIVLKGEGQGIIGKLRELQHRDEVNSLQSRIKELEKQFGKTSFHLKSDIREMQMVTTELENQKTENIQRLQQDNIRREEIKEIKTQDPKEMVNKYYGKKLEEFNEKKESIENNNSSVESILNSIFVDIKTESIGVYDAFRIIVGDFLSLSYQIGNFDIKETFAHETQNKKYYENSAVMHFIPFGVSQNRGPEKAKETLFVLILGIKKIINTYKTNPKLFNQVDKLVGITNAVFAKNMKTLGFKEVFKLDSKISNDNYTQSIGLEIQISEMLEQESRIDKLLQKLSKSFIENAEFRTTKN